MPIRENRTDLTPIILHLCSCGVGVREACECAHSSRLPAAWLLAIWEQEEGEVVYDD